MKNLNFGVLFVALFVAPFAAMTGLGTISCIGSLFEITMTDWETTKAQIVSSQLFAHGKDLSPEIRARMKEPNAVEFRYKYAFSVAGQTHTGFGQWKGELTLDQADERLATEFAVGQTIDVNYDSNDPNTNTVDKPTGDVLALILVGLLCFVGFLVAGGTLLLMVAPLLWGVFAEVGFRARSATKAGGGLSVGKIVFCVILCLILTLAGLGIHHRTATQKKNVSSRDWPTVTGTVLGSEIKRRIETDSKGRSTTRYVPVVRYEYVVGKAKYEGQNITAIDLEISYDYAHEFISRYPEGQQVEVYVNPTDPADALLEPDHEFVRTSSYFSLIGLAFFFALLVVLLLAMTFDSSAED